MVSFCTGLNSRAILAEIGAKQGSIHISTNVDGARVFSDGVYKGKSPVGFKAAPGLREVMAKSDGYKTTKIPVNVEALRNNQRCSLNCPYHRCHECYLNTFKC